ncbi:MAG: DotU family type IV/VI secretion system protein [Alphaproteobacteria bacterium]|nr:DotU family type IV/VI secretion system protein [Alphaproteobacteria bacterium]
MSRIKITSHSFLVQNFHEFFNLLLRQKELALRANDGNDPLKLSKQKGKKKDPDPILQPETLEETEAAITAAAEAANAATLESEHEEDLKEIKEPEEYKEQPLVNIIQRRLSILLEEQAIRSTIQAGEFAVSSYQESLYAMVAFADEVFLNIPWKSQKLWEDNLLESRFFQTQIAGELIFKKIEELISTNDPLKADLAIIYLLILGLGFKGQFRAEDANPEKLNLYRQQLFRMVNRHPSNLYDPGREHLIESCYEHVLDSTISKGLPEIRMWFLTFVGILGVYLFASTVLWYKLVKEMDSSISNILLQAQQMGIT